MNINSTGILGHKIRGVSGIICILMAILFLAPGQMMAGENGYLVVKDNETILDLKANTSITWQNKIWFTQKNVRVENTQETHRILLINMETGKIYQIDTQEKTYQILNFPEGIRNLYAQGELKSQKMDQEKKCGEWDCYGVKLMTQSKDISLETEYWLTKGVDLPFPLRKKIAKYFGPDQIRLTEELTKYEGYPVETVLRMKVNDKEVKMISKVVEVKQLVLDADMFQLPANYKQVESVMGGEPADEKAKDSNVADANKSAEAPSEE